MQILSAKKEERDGSAGIFSSILADMTKHCKAILAEIVDAESVEKAADAAQEELYNAVQKQQVLDCSYVDGCFVVAVICLFVFYLRWAHSKVCLNNSESCLASSESCCLTSSLINSEGCLTLRIA
jgi:hypothetical protein